MLNFFKRPKDEKKLEEKRNKKILKKLDYSDKKKAELLLACDNKLVLYKAFYQVENEKLQEIILYKINSQDFLEKIAQDRNISESLRIEAIKKIKEKNDKFWYDIIITEDRKYEQLVRFCIEKIKNENVLADIVMYADNYCGDNKELWEWHNIEKKILVVEAIEDSNILERLFYICCNDYVKMSIINKIKDENVLMKIYRKSESNTKIINSIVYNLQKHCYENSLAEITINSHGEYFIRNNINHISSKESLCKIIENAQSWYAILLAEEKLKKLK